MLEIKLLPKQWEVFNPDPGAQYDIKLYQGGFGAGKTFLGGLKGNRVLSENHGATWLVVADAWERLKITTWETWLELLDGAKISHKANKSDHIIRIPGWGNARVIFKGIDNPMALRSVNGIGGHLEEASLLTEAAYLEFLGRLRQAGPESPIQVILTTNPQATRGWLYDHFVINGGITHQEIRGNTVVINRRRVIASTLENRHVSDAFIATLKASYDPELYRIVVEGQDGDYTRGLVSYNFSDSNIQDTPFRPELDLHLTCDFNVDPMSWELAHRFNGEYHYFDEIVIENTNINECVDEFVRRYPAYQGKLIIGGDASGNSRNVQNDEVGGTSYTQMVNRFNFHKYPARVRVDVREKNPPIADRVAAWNAMMCNTNGVRRIFINPKCKWLIHNLENLKYQEGTGVIETPSANDIKKDPKQKFLGHPFDAASYLVEKYDPVILTTIRKPENSVIIPKGLRF
jgi:phage terminase large subunit